LQEFVAAPALAPPEVTVDREELARIEQEMKTAAEMPLPDEEGDDF
jgi:GTP-binding nuclear protein Ran